MKITCQFCTWIYEFRSPEGFNEGVFQCGAHYARCHDGMLEQIRNFDPEKLYLLPDPRQEVKSHAERLAEITDGENNEQQ